MNLAGLAVILGFAGACVTALVTWVIARRSTSGSVDTSEAASLWSESSVIRGELREEIVGLRAQLTAATASIVQLLAKIQASDEATSVSRLETARSRAETAQLRVEIAQVHRGVSQVNRGVAEVRAEVITGNAQTAGMLLDNQESRRIAEIPEGERTETERSHIATVGIRGEENGDTQGQQELEERADSHD